MITTVAMLAAIVAHGDTVRERPVVVPNRPFTVREETIDDAVSALELLRDQPEVDAARTYLLGHSLGGYLAPRIAAADRKLAGMILMAGAWLTPLPQLMVEQMDYIVSVTPREDSARVAAQRRVIRHNVDRIMAMTAADSGSLTLFLGAPAAYWIDLLHYDPISILRSQTEPILILQGQRDYQVTPSMLEQFLSALGQRPATTILRYPALNHLFIAGAGTPRPAEYSEAGQVAEVVMDDIANWVLRRR